MERRSSNRDASNEPGVLIVIMGTSGTGKSTLGISLGKQLSIPFVDGDDLHPAHNIAKMSAGQPLTDDDRLPWLLRIRQAAYELISHPSGVSDTVVQAEDERAHQLRASNAQGGQARRLGDGEEGPSQEAEDHDEAVRKMAEVLETSTQPDADPEHHLKPTQPSSAGSARAGRDPGQDGEATTSPTPTRRMARPRRACLIACSALKRTYRDLLRAPSSCTAFSQADSPPSPPSTTTSEEAGHPKLEVYFLYIRVSRDELYRRMEERKAHFMKKDMLRSQLETLEEPHPSTEPHILTLDGVGSHEAVCERAEALIRERVGAVRGPPSSFEREGEEGEDTRTRNGTERDVVRAREQAMQ